MAEGLFPDLQPHHAAISVGDIEAAIAFWDEVFGFEIDFRTEIAAIGARIAFVRRGDFRIELFEIAGSAAVPQSRRAPNTDLGTQGTKHICFSVEDVQGALETLHARGVRIVGVMRGHGEPMSTEDDPGLDGIRKPAIAFFFLDPSDTLIEIVRRGDFRA